MKSNNQVFHISMGMDIYVQEWTPAQVKGVVVLVHGLGEHIGRYVHVARKLNDAGYTVLGFDLPGHGHSDGPRGHISSYQMVMDLISRILDHARASYPNVPLFLYGHSLGGNLVQYYVMTCKPSIAGVISTSPGLGTAAPVSPVTRTIGKIMYQLVPGFSLPNGLDITGLSRNEKVVQAYKEDPLVHGKVSARLGLDLLNNGEWIVEHAAEFPDIPLLLMQGSADRVVSSEKIRQFAANYSNGKITFQVWEGLYHELHNEFEQEEVLSYIVDWMDRQIK